MAIRTIKMCFHIYNEQSTTIGCPLQVGKYEMLSCRAESGEADYLVCQTNEREYLTAHKHEIEEKPCSNV